MTTIGDIIAELDRRYPHAWAAEWDRVGAVCGRPERPVARVLYAVDCVAATVAEARHVGADLMVVHHPLLLRSVSSVAPVSYKGEIVHTLIESGIGLYVAHTNADVAAPGVSDALAARLGLHATRPLAPEPDAPERGIGRIGRLSEPLSLTAFTELVADALPATAGGVRAAGHPDRPITTVAVSGGAGDGYLDRARDAGVDAFVTADLRHHSAGEFVEADGPALVDASHWATERPWLDAVASEVAAVFDVDNVVSDVNTDPWSIHVASAAA